MKKNDINFFLRRWSLVLLSAALVVVSAHVDGLHWLAMLWILPLALALHGASVKQAVLRSFVCALGFWILSISWVLRPLLEASGATVFFGGMVFLLVCVWQAIPYAVLGFCYAYFRWDRHVAGPFLAAAALTVAWSYWPTLIPGLPQHSLYHYPALIAVLDISGTSGLLFLSALLCFSIQYSVVSSNSYSKLYIVLAILIPILMLSYGIFREQRYQVELQSADKEQWLSIAYLQPSLLRSDSASRLYEMSEDIIKRESPDLLVWPENPIVYSFIDRNEDRQETIALSKKHNQNMLINSGYVYANDDAAGQARTYYNRVHLLQNGVVTGEYSKQLLVPFFEYMPPVLSFLRKWMPNVLYYRAGKEQAPIVYNENATLAVMICYEAIFPSLVRTLINDGGNVIINTVSDTWFERSRGAYYHLALAYFRGIEHRVPLIRVANSGVSVVVAANGEFVSMPTQLFEVSGNAVQVFIPEKRSLYSWMGDWFSALLLMLLLACLVNYFRLRSFRLFG